MTRAVFCPPPPPVGSFWLADVGDSFAILQWSMTSRSRHGFELDYRSLGDDSAVRLSLPNSQKLVLLRGLKSATNYTAEIFSTNACALGRPTRVDFQTKTLDLHPAVSHMMPHEIVLTCFVFLIWAIILRHFFLIYNRMAFVRPLTLGGYLTRNVQVKGSRSVSRASSHRTLMSKGSNAVPNQFNLLEQAVCQWRSETVLSPHRRLSVPHLTQPRSARFSQCMETASTTSPRESEPAIYSRSPRSSVVGPRIFLTSTSPTSARRLSVCEKVMLPSPVSAPGAIDSPHNWPPAPLPFQPLLNVSVETEDSQPEPVPVTPSPTSPKGEAMDTVKRKISEVLLGKATRDIRRCSTFVRSDAPTPPTVKRRKSLFASWTSGFGSFRRRRRTRKWLEALREEKEFSPPSGTSGRDLPSQDSVQEQSARDSLPSTTLDLRPLLRGNSGESYVTAASVLVEMG